MGFTLTGRDYPRAPISRIEEQRGGLGKSARLELDPPDFDRDLDLFWDAREAA